MTVVRRLALLALLVPAPLGMTTVGCRPRGKSPAPKPGAAATGTGAASATPAAPAGPDAKALMIAYDRGLDFLASRATDGVFGVRGTPNAGVTALCLLPMLERPGGMRERDEPVVGQGLAFLAKSLGENGGVNVGPTSAYETSTVVLALAASKKALYAGHLERAVSYLRTVLHGDANSPAYGGMGTTPEDPRADLSITYYGLMAFAAAGVAKDDPVWKTALVYLQRCQNRRENDTAGEPKPWTNERGDTVVRGSDGGAHAWPGASKAGYDAADGDAKIARSYGSVTCGLLHGYLLAGLEPNDPRVRAAREWMAAHWAVDHNPGMTDQFPEKQAKDGMYFYFASLARAFPALGVETLRGKDGHEIDWRADLAKELLASQKPDGSWQSPDVLWLESVSVVATSFSLIALEPCAR